MAISLPYQLTKTLLCALNEMQAITGVDPLYLTNTTLNSKYNIYPTTLPAASPKLSFFGIGIRGFKNLDDENLSAPYIPSSKNLDLYTPIPFRIVPIDDDLTPTERMNYRMRVMRTIGDESYWAYYLKKLEIIDNRVKIIRTNITTGVEEVLDELDSSNLTPTPTVTSAEAVTQATEKISVSLSASINITGNEVIEAINVLYNGNLLRARVSEIGLYTANDQLVTMSDGLGGTFESNEAIFAALAYHYTNQGINFSTPDADETMLLRLDSASSFLV